MTQAPLLSALTSGHAAFAADRHADPLWVRALRDASLARVLASGLPSRRDEEWKYTSVRSLSEQTLAPAALADLRPQRQPSAAAAAVAGVPAEATGRGADTADLVQALLAPHLDPADHTLVFVDGVLSTAFSRLGELPAGLAVLSLEEALATRESLVRHLLERQGPAWRQPFADLNGAFLRDGVLIDVARNLAVPRRLHLVHVSTGEAAFFPRHLVVLGESADAQVVETFLGADDVGYLVASATEVELGPNSRLRHAALQLEGRSAFHVARFRATLARDARLETLSLSAGARLARTDLDVALTGPGAHAQLDGLYLVKGRQHVDHHTAVDHLVPDATSDQLYKGVLDGESRAVFNGKVYVRQDAQRTNAFQLNRNLLLSSDAEVDTKPELQIDADDVKCSHGAAVGQLDQDQLFYLESRGLRPDEAMRLLTQAFADEVLLKDTVPGLARRLRPLTKEFFAR